jgi:hypothetical protein
MRTLTTAAFRLIVASAVAVSAGCTGERTVVSRSGAPDTATPGSSPAAQTHLVRECPVTVPRPVPSSEEWKQSLFGSDYAHGNDKLWVGGLGEGGVIDVGPDYVEPDGSVGMKFGWWRLVPGTLQITGRRLDGAAPAVRANVPSGYGDLGFQSSGVYFPTPGCWEVTGTVGTASLSFVTLVVKQGS